MERRYYVLFKRRHVIPTRYCGDVPLRRLGNVPPRRFWLFYLRLTWGVVRMYRETLLRHRHDVFLPGGAAKNLNKGPRWSKDHLLFWLTRNVEKINQETIAKIQLEVKGPTTFYKATKFQESQQKEKMTPFGIDENKYSSTIKLVRITTYINHFVQKPKKFPTPKGVPTSGGWQVARKQWIKT